MKNKEMSVLGKTSEIEDPKETAQGLRIACLTTARSFFTKYFSVRIQLQRKLYRSSRRAKICELFQKRRIRQRHKCHHGAVIRLIVGFDSLTSDRDVRGGIGAVFLMDEVDLKNLRLSTAARRVQSTN